MYNSKSAKEIFDLFAKEYEKKFMYLDEHYASFDFFCSLIEKTEAKLLELACGPGNITNYLIKKLPNLNILATDISENMLKLAIKNVPKANFQLMDARDIKTITEQYDAIMCGFCLPYLSKKESIELIVNASKIISNKGVLYISTMEGLNTNSNYISSSSGKGPSVFTYYHEADYLTEALENNNFEIITLNRQEYTEQTRPTDLIIIAKKIN